jgi:hypothetical protein
MKRILALIAIGLMTVASIFPADLRNEDGKRYEVKVHESSTTRNTYIDARSTTLSICSDCEIEVVGVGKIRVKGSERAVIKDGKLTKQ